MALPSDQRLLDLLDKWVKSLELHLKYASLDDASYMQIQPWPAHQRPSRWIIELAKQKAIALRAQVEERIAKNDAHFSDSLELMAFLANLVGAEHIERFIPLAHAENELDLNAATAEHRAASASTGTREMPKFAMTQTREASRVSTPEVARVERSAAPAAPTPTPAPKLEHTSMHDTVIADAARLVQWGRKWYELAELIAAMADRPTLIEVRRILIDNKTVIEKKAGRG
jgi:hypothetical protein